MASQWFLEFLRRFQILVGDKPSVARADWVIEALPPSVSIVEHHVIRSILTDYAARLCLSVGQGVDQRRVVSLLDVATEREDTRALTTQFVHVIELCGRTRETGGDAVDARVPKALMEIARQYANPDFTLGRLARDLATTPARLTKLLKRHTDKTFQAHLREHRISAAKQLLRSQALRVKEVALRVGYRRTSRLDHDFRLVSGVTASEYREQPPSPPPGRRVAGSQREQKAVPAR